MTPWVGGSGPSASSSELPQLRSYSRAGTRTGRGRVKPARAGEAERVGSLAHKCPLLRMIHIYQISITNMKDPCVRVRVSVTRVKTSRYKVPVT